MDIIDTTNSVDEKQKRLTLIIYILYLASLFVGITSVVAIIVNYIKKPEVQGTYLESHFRWQIRTFWFCILWAVVGTITLYFIIGVFILIGNGIWFIYRMVRGLLALNDGKAMYVK